jgi:hypothetical protein
MTNVLWRAIALAGLVAVGLPARADDTIAIKSPYSDKFLVPDARQVRLSVTLDDKGNGSGTLTLDPNIHDEFGSTCIAITDIPVRVRLVQADGRDAKDRRLYELKRVGEEGKVDEGGERWLLVRPLKAGTPQLLIFVGEGGKFHDVLTLE